MRMPMVQIRIVRMAVDEPAVPMSVRMRFSPIPGEIMFVLMMRVVDVSVLMLQRFVLMPVLVSFGEMKAHSDRH